MAVSSRLQLRLVPWLSDDLKPTILIGKSNVALASNLERAREALSAELPAGNPGGRMASCKGRSNACPKT